MHSYNKKMLSMMTTPELCKIYNKVSDLNGREYNRGVSGYIIDEFLSRMESEDSLNFLPYMPTFLATVQAGMFDTASRYLQTITTTEALEPLKQELIKCLIDADNEPKTPVNTVEVDESESETQE